jgi:hypothetical protein
MFFRSNERSTGDGLQEFVHATQTKVTQDGSLRDREFSRPLSRGPWMAAATAAIVVLCVCLMLVPTRT